MKLKVTTSKTLFKGIDQNPSLLGFGCMRFPTLYEGKPDIDEELAQIMIDYAYEHGVTYYDTAYPYHNGLSELFVGKALKKYPRESFYLATKMPTWLIHSLEDTKRIFQEQLNKLQVTYFDYYLCHALNRDNYKAYLIPGVMDFLKEMKKEGKIHHLGFSFHDTPDILEEIIHKFDWDFVQLQINYLDWDFIDAKRMYATVENYGVPVIVMEPVRGGTLASLSEEARAVFKEASLVNSIASWAIRYAASKKNVLVVLSGMSNEEQTIDNIKTMSDFHPITDQDQLIIDRALSAYLESQTIPCTACGYCMPCPHGVDIPGVFKIYNNYAVSKQKWQFLRDMGAMEETKLSSSCIRCGDCLPLCPQHIEIPDRMEEINELYEKMKAEQNKS